MKRSFIAMIFFVSIGFNAYSQCTPVNFGGTGYLSPDTTQGLQPVVSEYSHSQQINVHIPLTVQLPGLPVPVPIDSAGILNVIGLPAGLSYVTNSPNDFWHKGVYGCALIQGTASIADTGKHYIQVMVEIHALSQYAPYSFGYELLILDSINYGVNPIENQGFELSQNSPNPVENTTNIKFFSQNPAVYDFEVYDLIGNKVHIQTITAHFGINNINFNRGNLPSGVYFYKLSSGNNSEIKRMIIK